MALVEEGMVMSATNGQEVSSLPKDGRGSQNNSPQELEMSDLLGGEDTTLESSSVDYSAYELADEEDGVMEEVEEEAEEIDPSQESVAGEDLLEDADEESLSFPTPQASFSQESTEGTSSVFFDELEDEEEEGTSSEDRLRELGDLLIAALIRLDDKGRERRRSLFPTVRPELFKEENYVLYKVLYNLRDRNLVPDEEFLSLYLTRNRKLLLDADGKRIDITAFGEVEEDVVSGYIAGVVKHFSQLKTFPELSDADFSLTLEKYRLEFQGVEAEALLYDALDMLVEGTQKKSGFDDAADFVRRGLGEIGGLVDQNQGSGFISMRELLAEDTSFAQMYKVCDFGEIRELNEHFGGVYSSLLYTILAPPKAGKTKFCARLAHNAAVLEGRNISIWAPEGGPQMWSAQLRSIHFDHTYNNSEDSRRVSLGVDQITILRDTFKNDETRIQERLSAQDLVTNPEYGNIDFIDRPFKVETFLDEIDTSVKANGSSLLVIDYMQQMGSDRSSLSKSDILSRAYPALLDYAKKNNIAVISPGQFKQEVVNELAKGASSGEMRTAGGESSEIIRASDVTLALWASTDDLAHNRTTLLSVPTRIAAPFDPIPMYVDLGSCSFYSMSSD